MLHGLRAAVSAVRVRAWKVTGVCVCSRRTLAVSTLAVGLMTCATTWMPCRSARVFAPHAYAVITHMCLCVLQDPHDKLYSMLEDVAFSALEALEAPAPGGLLPRRQRQLAAMAGCELVGVELPRLPKGDLRSKLVMEPLLHRAAAVGGDAAAAAAAAARSK
jgi:hypothetical protein